MLNDAAIIVLSPKAMGLAQFPVARLAVATIGVAAVAIAVAAASP